ncbi:MAG: hypothetical protein SOW31_08895 [Treponema sp.]|nr:hypothetical protein [Treponema sp.]
MLLRCCFVTDEIELPVLWQSPNPRFVINMEELHIPKMMVKRMGRFKILLS